MRAFVGTSGYSYKEWKGHFYPKALPAARMLQFYAARLAAVEINNTFYRLPRQSVLESWAEQVPDGFLFAIKASRRITHIKRLKEAEDETAYLLRTLKTLGQHLGVILFQLPPYLRKDLPRLERFLDLLPASTPAAFEFRHGSWFDDTVFERLQDRNFSLCVTEADGESEARLIQTASWGYLRLRRAAYSETELSDWAERLRSENWDTVYVFFKHEDEGAGPRLAVRFAELTSPVLDPPAGPLPGS